VSQCNASCDNCANPVQADKHDISEYAKQIVEIIDQIHEKDDRVTFLQLIDIWRGTGKKSLGANATKAPEEWSKSDCERVIMQLVIGEVLKEKFTNTAYSTNSYLMKGKNAGAILLGKMSLHLYRKKNAKKTNTKEKEATK